MVHKLPKRQSNELILIKKFKIMNLKAMLKMNANYSIKDKRQRVDEVLEEVIWFFYLL